MLVRLNEVRGRLDHQDFKVRGARLDERLVDSIVLDRDEVGRPKRARLEFYAALITEDPEDLEALEKLMRGYEDFSDSPPPKPKRRGVKTQLNRVARLLGKIGRAAKGKQKKT